MKQEYINHLSAGEHQPFIINGTSASREHVHDQTIRLTADINRMLIGEGIEAITVGSMSPLLQLGRAYTRTAHDVDFLVKTEQLVGFRNVLRRNNFSFWDENTVHRTARNLTGGFGRHHNFGASHEAYTQDSDLPIWIGVFSNDTQRGIVEHREIYAVSQFKIQTSMQEIFSSSDFPQEKKQEIQKLLHNNLSMDRVLKLIDLLALENINFWEIINNPTINGIDIERRTRRGPKEPEAFLEVEMQQTYDVGFDDYTHATDVEVFDTRVSTFTLGGTLQRMKKYYPHYLGSREKYQLTTSILESSGKIDDADKQRRIYEDRKTLHTPINVFIFSHDLTLDPQALERLLHPSIDSGINYFALLLEGVHYKRL